ncbi:hypothetical protein Q648_00281 [Bartonella quintana JK 12]|uniref:Uncharacterized protein n=2 Tax=Bartonella quintana TaxID=803 RepID=W3TWP2_BARQI|nr:hypothetical protein Q651_00222 [Bartonella quintana BQ2-D70]ETS14074.1 hypothetical protein Q650_00694 [Bartonella quintana JK 73rel]ETS15761.1 hypothetical protein Q649_00703 [Bartonella quintana JK 73]ETS17764.1 hypothetical protein Q647_00692 [Bartonella quintana JK 7]ETS18593.1 hypothetical protein Q648_00281 [Bartonella quintana JK 12]KEC59227.1 hypothetical protein O93_00558 [Bartonella quintana JK 19]KEC62669.1 hypothetical protein O7Y_00706 [Bartonella quintana JK 63]KEC63473.1 h
MHFSILIRRILNDFDQEIFGLLKILLFEKVFQLLSVQNDNDSSLHEWLVPQAFFVFEIGEG